MFSLIHKNQDSVTNTLMTLHPVGCETLLEGADPVIADVVFIHGLHGHRTETWTKDMICWPRDLLANEESLSHIRVLTFGYNANVDGSMNNISQNTLFDHARSLLNELGRIREGDLSHRHILFIAHSLGGLLVKAALHESYMADNIQPHLGATFKATKGIMFFGTPHRGSEGAAWEKILESIKRISIGVKNTTLIEALSRNSQILDRIGSDFSMILSKRTFQICSFTEELPMANIKGVGKIVETDSGIIGDGLEMRYTIHADHIQMVKFCKRDDAGYQSVIFAMKKLLSEHFIKEQIPNKQNKDVDAAQDLDWTRMFDNVPYPVSHLIHREGLLSRIGDSFRRTFSPSIVVLVGMGGAGKTELAADYCGRLKKSGLVKKIFWIDASSRKSMHRSMEVIAKQLFPQRELDEGVESASLVKGFLSASIEEWIIVFDGLDNPSELDGISAFFPDHHGHGSILVTSRYTGSGELGEVIEVKDMEEAEGIQLLCWNRAVNEEHSAAREILKLVGHLPLAIDQARAYISKTKLELKYFVEEYEKRKDFILRETPRRWNYQQSVLTTWEMSLSLLGVGIERKEGLKNVLTVFAFFHPNGIREELFSKNWNAKDGRTPMSIFKVDGRWDHMEYERALVEMQELSLLEFSRRTGSDTAVSLHPLVSEWLRIRLENGSRREFLETAIFHLKNYLDSAEHDDVKRREEALSHVNLMTRGEELWIDNERLIGACWRFGEFYRECGLYTEAKRMLESAFSNSEKAFGPDDTSTLNTVDSLGLLYSEQGCLGDAEKMYARALAGKEKTLGPDHTSTLDTVYNLGILYKDQGRLADAENMYGRALSGYEKALGPIHTSTLRTVYNLGLLYKSRSRLTDAEKLYERAPATYEKTLGSDHTLTLNAVHNLGLLYEDQSRLIDAEKMYDRALAGYERVAGLDHKSTLNTVYHLGTLYKSQGRFADAEKMYECARAGYEKTLGSDHTLTLSTVHHLGLFYKDQGRIAEAEKMYCRALAGYGKVMGPEHESTLNTAYHLGNLYKSQGRSADAEKMYERALAGYEKMLDSDHTLTLNAVDNLRIVYSTQGRVADAKKLYERVLVGYEKTFGSDHISTLNLVYRHGTLCESRGCVTDAVKMYQRVLAGYEKALGPDHKSTLKTVYKLGILYKSRGRPADAEKMYDRALAGYRNVFGPDHKLTLGTAYNLGVLYKSQGRFADAKKMYERALAGYEKTLGSDHTSTLKTVHDLGLLYQDQDRLIDAEKMYDRALAGYEKTLGPVYKSTLDTVYNLGILYMSRGRLAVAEKMYDRALAGYGNILGPDHKSTLDTVYNLGILYKDQGRLPDAEKMYDRALAGYEKTLSPHHESTLNTVSNIGRVYHIQGRLVDAEKMYERALAGKEIALGFDHTSTLNTVYNLGLLYRAQGRLADAEEMFERALARYEQTRGPDHQTSSKS